MGALQKSSRKLLILRCFIKMRMMECIQSTCSGLLSVLPWGFFSVGENPHESNRPERQVHMTLKLCISSLYQKIYFELVDDQD